MKYTIKIFLKKLFLLLTSNKKKDLKLLHLTLEKELIKKLLHCAIHSNSNTHCFSSVIYQIRQYFALEEINLFLIDKNKVLNVYPQDIEIQDENNEILNLISKNNEDSSSSYTKIASVPQYSKYLFQVKYHEHKHFVMHIQTKIELLKDDTKFLSDYIIFLLMHFLKYMKI